MKYNKDVEQQLSEYIKTPAVLVGIDDAPYEFVKDVNLRKLRARRQTKEIPSGLFACCIHYGATKNQIREFASGYLINYIETSKIYG